ncbi:MAG: SLBB domain-containing protein [Desulfocapsa sp.]|uniref:SLBB domain-containing protein n=1 Tax=Desulfotalea psychrophila TaxID=84980 RepID=A0ABS3AU47_9BACT|nr:SLBB domain-containing protein [Desulfocapsa sp.]MBN4068616.1 SLBB domain-containing protein [Desulfotalea psychrophila]
MQKLLFRTTFFFFLASSFIVLLLFLPPDTLAENYIIGSGDVLQIDVYDHDDLKKTVRVSNNGSIVIPFIGQIQVDGMTIPEVTKKLTTLLGNGYIVNPQVNIFIEEFRSKKVIVLGQITRPGIVKLRGATTFLEIISQAGGMTQKAGDTATIKRVTDGKQDVFVVDIKSMVEGGDLSQNILIQDGDTIYIPKGGMCYVTGEVGNPDAYPCNKNTTVLKLIARSGGFTGKASKSSVRIVRIVDGKKKTFKNVDLGTSVLANDIIVVPESFF